MMDVPTMGEILVGHSINVSKERTKEVKKKVLQSIITVGMTTVDHEESEEDED